MIGRSRSIALALALAATAGGPGCANLVVKKVSPEDRACGTDDQRGFRYYLNRPYLIVKKAILISEKKTMVSVQGPVVTFLEGQKKGQTIALQDLCLKSPDGSCRKVTEEELQELRKRICDEMAPATAAAGAGAGAGATTTTGANRSAQDNIERAGSSITDAGTATASRADTKDLQLPNVGTLPDDNTLSGDMQIVYLPDLDEQYVVRHKNLLAKSAFGLVFRNGTELTSVQGNHDTTTLAISLLEQIDKAIGAAKGVATARIQQESKAQSGQGGTAGNQRSADGGAGRADAKTKALVLQLVERVSIRPGVYRLNKPWEIVSPGGDHPTGSGLLEKLGLPTTTDLYIEQVGTITDP